MHGLRRMIDRRLVRVRRIEPFVRRIVAGGFALVGGLWLADFGVTLGGLALVILGTVALATGIWRQIDV